MLTIRSATVFGYEILGQLEQIMGVSLPTIVIIPSQNIETFREFAKI